jgi:hypothetical protein
MVLRRASHRLRTEGSGVCASPRGTGPPAEPTASPRRRAKQVASRCHGSRGRLRRSYPCPGVVDTPVGQGECPVDEDGWPARRRSTTARGPAGSAPIRSNIGSVRPAQPEPFRKSRPGTRFTDCAVDACAATPSDPAPRGVLTEAGWQQICEVSRTVWTDWRTISGRRETGIGDPSAN